MACQVQRNRRELLRCSTLLEQDVEVLWHFHHLPKVVLELCGHVCELFLSVRHFYDAHAKTSVVKQFLLGSLHYGWREARGTSIEIVLHTLVLFGQRAAE